MTEFMKNNGRSEPGGAEGSVAVGESPAEVGTTAVGAVPTAEARETILLLLKQALIDRGPAALWVALL